MSGWTRSAARAPARRAGARPEGSWGLAVERARAAWDDLTGGPAGGRYSDLAAAAILATALGLWADTVAVLASGDGPPED